MILFINAATTDVKSYGDDDQQDPRLSMDGEEQAQQTGHYIKKIIDEYLNSQGIQEKDLKVVTMSSPSLACIQTAANLIKQLPFKSKINIQEELSDLMLPRLYKQKMGEDLYQIYKQNWVGDLKKSLGVDIILDKHLKSNKLFPPQYPEDQNYCRARIGSFILELINSTQHQKDKMARLFLCVTHEGVEEIVIDHFNGKCKEINSCAITQVLLSMDSNDGKLGIKGYSVCK